jgi:uncharacterized protein (DUF1330 family)
MRCDLLFRAVASVLRTRLPVLAPARPNAALILTVADDRVGHTGPVTAYVISDVVGRDPELVARYRELARDSIAKYDGWYLSNVGAEIDHVEGEWQPTNVVMVGFPSMARAREWYASQEYAAALTVRQHALSRSLVFVAGADEA